MKERESEYVSKDRVDTSTILSVIVAVLTLLGMLLCLPNLFGPPTPTATPTATRTPTPEITWTPTPKYELEVTGRTSSWQSGVLGQLAIEYPLIMLPGSSDVFVLQISIPELLASVEPMAVSQVRSHSDVPRVVGQPNSFMVVVCVTETMRAELTSIAFNIQNNGSSIQEIDLDDYEKTTYWTWTIQPKQDVAGSQILTLLLYPDNSDTPWWSGHLEVDVVNPTPTPGVPTVTPTYTPQPTFTPTPSPTSTPQPPLIRVGDAVIDDFPAVLTAILTFIIGIVGLRLQYGKTQHRIKDLEDEIENLTTEHGIVEKKLRAEIKRLKTIKWWQFWRR
jgi:hypothetical protein